jgi:hypothetical protein
MDWQSHPDPCLTTTIQKTYPICVLTSSLLVHKIKSNQIQQDQGKAQGF